MEKGEKLGTFFNAILWKLFETWAIKLMGLEMHVMCYELVGWVFIKKIKNTGNSWVFFISFKNKKGYLFNGSFILGIFFF